MIDLGAQTTDLDYIQCMPGGLPDGKKYPNLFTNVDRFIFVNMDGKRFIHEDARRDVLRDEMLNQPKLAAWTIVDADGFELQKNPKAPENEAAQKASTLYIANTIEELAKKAGLLRSRTRSGSNSFLTIVRIPRPFKYASPRASQIMPVPEPRS